MLQKQWTPTFAIKIIDMSIAAVSLIKSLENRLRDEAEEKTKLYIAAERDLDSMNPDNAAHVMERYRNARRLYQLATRKYKIFLESLNENKYLFN
jgi:hypothetical protein